MVNTHGRACFVGGSQQRWKSNALSFVAVVVCRFLDFDIDGGLSGQNAPLIQKGNASTNVDFPCYYVGLLGGNFQTYSSRHVFLSLCRNL